MLVFSQLLQMSLAPMFFCERWGQTTFPAIFVFWPTEEWEEEGNMWVNNDCQTRKKGWRSPLQSAVLEIPSTNVFLALMRLLDVPVGTG